MGIVSMDRLPTAMLAAKLGSKVCSNAIENYAHTNGLRKRFRKLGILSTVKSLPVDRIPFLDVWLLFTVPGSMLDGLGMDWY